jgi:hypothetical protein
MSQVLCSLLLATVGTWSMRLIGENFLQGKVDFRSELEEGTTFCLELPEAPAL